ncbi:hypothetical protein ACFQUU_02190 [Herbaspirillum sp. GCM10030257]|uniref:hypothetical protein n=1 Tax=Herbaspirillum sp. GCM10030257 TaxID=3273393 RepID=UPI00361F9C17
MELGMSASLVAREAGITAIQLFQWRKPVRKGNWQQQVPTNQSFRRRSCRKP